jgi:hypothetical protein
VSDSSQAYEANARIPVDDNVYTITGQIVGEVASLSQQTAPAQGELTGLGARGYGYVGGAYFGPEFGGNRTLPLGGDQALCGHFPEGSALSRSRWSRGVPKVRMMSINF